MNEWVRGAGALLPLHRRLGRTPGPRTFPAPFPLFSLDRIWVTPRWRMRRLWVHRSPLARAASDHLPLVAELDLGAALSAWEEPR
jgi:endonuclease/exonuclease/phosphatase family metal-dependent hydrolase